MVLDCSPQATNARLLYTRLFTGKQATGSMHKGIPTDHYLSPYEDAGATTDDN
jgi:hypothetical protein